MSQDHLGLFDTPPTPREVRISIAIVAILGIAALAIMPFVNVPWPPVPEFVVVVDTVILVGDLIIAAMFSAQASLFRSRSLTVLAAGYIFIGLILIPQALTFPGVFAPDGLLGADLSSAAWFSAIRRLVFPFIPILYVLLRHEGVPDAKGTGPKVGLGMTAGVGLAVATTLLVLAGKDYLPALFTSHEGAIFWKIFVFNITAIALTLTALAFVFRKRKSVLDMWLMVALASWLIQSLMNLPLHSRYSAGWYALYLMMLVSNMIILGALVTESNRIYARLAVTTAARNRERRAGRMSVDAVAAAISHEVGQPLAALSLNATAAINSLTAARPNVGRAIESLYEINDSTRKSFDVLRSIRSMFRKEPGWAGEIDLNALVAETVGRMDREVAGARVLIDLSLASDLPRIVANVVQFQHVVGNLVANALESLSAIRGRRRHLDIATSFDGSHVLLEISDNGVAIAEEDTWRVFDAFHHGDPDTKGIRLSLCRTIVEEHGGSIWASRDAEYGTTFHVKLPARRSSRDD